METRDQAPESSSQKGAEVGAQGTEMECSAVSSVVTLVRSCSPPALKVNPDKYCQHLLIRCF